MGEEEKTWKHNSFLSLGPLLFYSLSAHSLWTLKQEEMDNRHITGKPHRFSWNRSLLVSLIHSLSFTHTFISLFATLTHKKLELQNPWSIIYICVCVCVCVFVCVGVLFGPGKPELGLLPSCFSVNIPEYK